MSYQSSSTRKSGTIIAGLGVLTVIGGLLILLDWYTTQQAANEAESGGGFAGAISAIGDIISLYFEMIMRSTIVTAITLLIVGIAFVYVGMAIKNTEAMLEAESETAVDSQETFGSTLEDLVPTQNDVFDLSDGENRIAGVGAIVGLIVGLITNASILLVIVWIGLFAALSWLSFTPSGKEILRDAKEQVEEYT